MSRDYTLSLEAREQRSKAARARWDALKPGERTEALRPAFSATTGRPKKKRKGVSRDANGRFAKILS